VGERAGEGERGVEGERVERERSESTVNGRGGLGGGRR